MNYELVYKVREAQVSTESLSNLTIGYQNEARAKAAAEHKKYTDLLAKLIGHSNFEVTNVSCMASGIIGHVYAAQDGRNVEHGYGRRKCVFCDCDDFND